MSDRTTIQSQANKLVDNVLSLEPGGGAVRLDTRPRAPRSISTERGEPYRRVRALEDGHELEIYVAFRKDNAPPRLLSVAKQYGPEVSRLATWAADDLVKVLAEYKPSLVMPLPSGSPLAQRFGQLLANRLGVELVTGIEKKERMRAVPIRLRKMKAQQSYSVTGQYRRQTIVIVDDYVVTGSSLMAAAVHLYGAGAKKVLGAALAI